MDHRLRELIALTTLSAGLCIAALAFQSYVAVAVFAVLTYTITLAMTLKRFW